MTDDGTTTPDAPVGGRIDIVSENDRRIRPQPEKIARLERADDVAMLASDGEVTDLPTIHAADGAIDIVVGVDGYDGP